MCHEKYLAIDVGGTAIKYTLTDKNAKTIKINEIKTRRNPEKLFESFDEIIRPHLNQIAGIAMSFPGKINAEHGIVNRVATFDWICNMPLKTILEEKYKLQMQLNNLFQKTPNNLKTNIFENFYKLHKMQIHNKKKI